MLKTTFHHLLKKFGRDATTVTTSKFLAASIYQYLRFCPKCIEQWGYYRLTWRFSSIKYCLEHCCHLLDRCGYCDQAIPLLPSPITFGQCPHCQKELQSCQAEGLMSAEERDYLLLLKRDLEFLLTPHPCESGSAKLLQFLGEQLRLGRVTRQESIYDVARRLKLPGSEIFFVEDGRTKNGAASLQSYLSYVHSSGLTFVDLISSFWDSKL